jgi:hypothetical protein
VTSANAGATALESAKDHTAVGVAACKGTEAQQWFPEDLYFQNSGATLLIVTSDTYAPAFTNVIGPNSTTFQSWKHSIGITTKLLTVSQIRSLYPAADDALSIKYAIEDSYRNAATRYVLLGGDASQVPVRYRSVLDGAGCGGSMAPAGTSHSFVFSDLFYENLYSGHAPGNGSEQHSGGIDNWDSNANGLFDESDWSNSATSPDNVDGFPDIAIGRIPAYSESVLQGTLAKIVAYEKMNPAYGGTFPPAGKFGWAEDVCYQNDDGSDAAKGIVLDVAKSVGGSFVGYSEEVGQQCPNPYPQGSLGVAAGSPYTTDLTTNAQGSLVSWADMQASLQASSFEWFSYVGHGSTYGLGWNQGYGTAQVSQLTNAYQPVVMATACQTAMFAVVPQCTPLSYRPPIYDASGQSSSNFGEAFLANPTGGAVAFIGENVVMGDSSTFPKSFYAQRANGFQRLGDMWRMAQQIYFAANTPFTPTNQQFNAPRIYLGIVNLLGDPSMRTP